MALKYCPDTSPADWLASSATPWMQLVTLGPAGFQAYARLRYIPDPTGASQSENDVEIPDAHPSELAQAQRALNHLAPFTNQSDECYFCLWEGYPWPRDPAVLDGPLVSVPHRRYVLFRGALAEFDGWQDNFGHGGPYRPAFIWPADRKWCLASDVDPHWAGIGGEHAAIESLVGATDLDAVPADPAVPPPHYL